MLVSYSVCSSTPKMEAINYSETLFDFQQSNGVISQNTEVFITSNPTIVERSLLLLSRRNWIHDQVSRQCVSELLSEKSASFWCVMAALCGAALS
jgi:hypothetical protein